MKNSNGYTVAAKLAFNGIVPQSNWNHDPTIKTIIGDTVALLLAW